MLGNLVNNRRIALHQACVMAELPPDLAAAILRVASERGLSPEAVINVIRTESNFDPRASTGSYYGLTQIGPATFREAGGRLAGMTWDEYKAAPPARQVDAYGAWLDHYKLPQKFQRAGIDVSSMTPQQQAALLQGAQFAPNRESWFRNIAQGNYNVPATGTKQAPFLGSTSFADMLRHFGGQPPNAPLQPSGSATGGLTRSFGSMAPPAMPQPPAMPSAAPLSPNQRVADAFSALNGAGTGNQPNMVPLNTNPAAVNMASPDPFGSMAPTKTELAAAEQVPTGMGNFNPAALKSILASVMPQAPAAPGLIQPQAKKPVDISSILALAKSPLGGGWS